MYNLNWNESAYFHFPMLYLQEDLSIKSTLMVELTTIHSQQCCFKKAKIPKLINSTNQVEIVD